MSDPEHAPALSFTELRANVTTGVWDQVRLAAKFITARLAGAVHETLVDLPTAVLKEDDPVSYHIDRARRGTERLHEIGAWALEQEMVPADAKAPLPSYNRYI